MTGKVPPGPDIDPALLEESPDELYDGAPSGYLSTLPDGTILKVNRTFLEWTGYAREELLYAKRLQDLMTVPSRIFHETHYAPLLRMQAFVNELAFDLVRRDGSVFPVLLNSRQRRDASDQPVLNRTTVFDATDRRRYERELLIARRRAEEAAKSKSDYLAMVSHEVRTPLTAMLSAVRLLESTDPSPRQERFLRILRSSTENLVSLVSDLLDLSKFEAGRFTLEERPMAVRPMVESLVQALASRAEEKGIELRVEVDPDVPESVLADPAKLGQVLTNLVGNAIKFTEKGWVALEVRSPGTRGAGAATDASGRTDPGSPSPESGDDRAAIRFIVRDTGIGIPAEHLAHIFDAFTQAGGDIGFKYGGTGLGLAISRRIVEMYGSTISVQSATDAGTTFTFDLRLRPA